MDVFDNDNVVYPQMASSLGKMIDQWIVGIPYYHNFQTSNTSIFT